MLCQLIFCANQFIVTFHCLRYFKRIKENALVTGRVAKDLLNSLQVAKMVKKTQQMESLGAVLDQSLKRFDLSQRLDAYGVWPIWNDVVGKTIARNAQPEKIRNGTLFVKVTSPVWMQQLQFMKEMIVDKINQRLNCAAVKNLFFMVGHIDTGDLDLPTEPQQGQAAEGAEIEMSVEFLESISDPEIRSAFKKLLKSYSRRKAKP